MKVYLATDHAGFEIKNKIFELLKSEGYEVIDCGPSNYNKEDDYPDFISLAAQKVSEDPQSFGVVFGGSGQGEAIVANKFKNVRCALFYSAAVPAQAVDISGMSSSDPYEMIRLTREHNNSNVLSIGVRFLTPMQIVEAVKVFLASPFSNQDRHIRRVEKIKKIEDNLYR